MWRTLIILLVIFLGILFNIIIPPYKRSTYLKHESIKYMGCDWKILLNRQKYLYLVLRLFSSNGWSAAYRSFQTLTIMFKYDFNISCLICWVLIKYISYALKIVNNVWGKCKIVLIANNQLKKCHIPRWAYNYFQHP